VHFVGSYYVEIKQVTVRARADVTSPITLGI